MKISELMTKHPVTVQQDATLRVALERMEQIEAHHLPVLNQHGVLVGIVTSYDYRHAFNLPAVTRRHWQDNKLVDHLLVSTVMTLAPTVVEADMLADDAIQIMLDKQIGCLPVMQDKTLVGIVTTTDIIRAFVKLLHTSPATDLG